MIELLDCTLRDGGYYTNWDFDRNLTTNYFQAMEKLPISYIEIGYRSLVEDGYKGEYNYCPNYLLTHIRSLMPTKKIGIILNEKEVKPEDIDTLLSFPQGTIDVVRMAIDPQNVKRAGETARLIKERGFEVGFNVMYMSKWAEYPNFFSEIETLNGVVDSFSMVDSFGSMFPEGVTEITKTLKSKLTCRIGFHGHNNLELAFANTLAAIDAGCDIIDATITGMGRGAGNLRTELLLSYLSSRHGISVDFNSLSTTVSDFDSLKEKYGWGTNLPYMVSGLSSLPQKDVMDWVTRRFYSINSILQALHNMRDKKSDNLKLPIFNENKDLKFDIALIVGGGPSGVNSAQPIKELLKKYEDKKACIIHASSKNAGYYNDIEVPQFFCLIGNEGHRLEKVFANFDVNKISCVLPPYPRKMGTYIPQQLVNKSYELKEVTFTPLYQDSHTALALQTAIELSTKSIYIAGYDGYDGLIGENERMLTSENEYLLTHIVDKEPNIEIATITASKYKGIKNLSVFRLLIE
ncbi:MAG: aldolase catalytic domain-containing protein [Dysgonomonas sp.]|nr:aldolase catalytic domain-containing protein [Dysgonomonas sp.]